MTLTSHPEGYVGAKDALAPAGPRLLLITDKFPPHLGGTAVIYGNWCVRFPPAAIRVLTVQHPAGWPAYDEAAPFPLERVPWLDIPKIRYPLAWVRMWRAALHLVRHWRPDVVHAGQALETGWIARSLWRRCGIPYVVHTYGEELTCWSRKSRWTWRQLRTILADAAAVTAISRYTAGLLTQLDLYHGPVTLLSPGVEVDRFAGGDGAAFRARHELGDGPILLTVGRLMRRKGHDRVLAGLRRICEQVPGCRYVIAGSGPEEARLRALAAELDLGSSVRFLGAVPRSEVPDCLAAGDVFVHPNRSLANGDVEGFGIVFLEAGAAGLPVIGGDSGGATEAVQHGVTGYLVDGEDVDEIVARCVELLRDPALRQRMGAAGREWAARFTWDAAAAVAWELSCRVAAGERSR